MDVKRTSLEMIAPSVEEAVERGLADLGVPSEAVEVEVLDEGNRGLFGLGARQARIRLTLKSVNEHGEPSFEKGNTHSETSSTTVVREPEVDLEPGTSDEIFLEEGISEEVYDYEDSEEDSDLMLTVARETVEELLDTMNVSANVTARYLEPDDVHSRPALLVDVQGDDLSFLIGPRGETLNALQYIAHLIVGKEMGRSVPLVVDVMSFRERRAQQIRRLASSMAEQAVRSGRRQALEPMPASERRLVHIELRQNPEVTTESIGEEPRRKVTIIPN
jgi:spoIIIJ-associated protein